MGSRFNGGKLKRLESETFWMTDSPRFTAALIGDEPLLVECGRLLIDRGHDIVAVATNSNGVRQWAQDFSVVCDANFSSPSNPLMEIEHDFLFSIANVQLIHPELLRKPKYGAINFHDGPLPTYSGLYVTSWSIINGEQEHAVTWHMMEARADVGPILKQRRFPIKPVDTAYTLNTKCFDVGVATFRELLASYFDDIVVLGQVATPSARANADFGRYLDVRIGVLWSQPWTRVWRGVRRLLGRHPVAPRPEWCNILPANSRPIF